MTTLESRLRVSPSWLIITSQDFFTSGRERWHLGTLPGKGRFWNGWIAGCSGDLSKCDSYFIVKRWNMMWKVDECQKIWWKWMGNGWTNKRFLLFSFGLFRSKCQTSPFSASGPEPKNGQNAIHLWEKKRLRLKRPRDEVPWISLQVEGFSRLLVFKDFLVGGMERFFNFHPEPWGWWSNLTIIFSKWVETTN